MRPGSTDIEVLGWTLVHFLWQGALIAALLQLFLVSSRKSSVQARYLARCLALAAMAVTPVATFALLRSDTALHGTASVLSSAAPPAATLAQRSLPWIVALWSLGAVFLSLRLCLGFLRVQRLQRHGSGGELPDHWQRSFERLAEALGVRAVARVVDSAVLAVPAVVGWLRPVVLIPARVLTGLDEDQILALLAHELAHVRRHDYLVNLVQSVLEALLFYHPAVWWVSSGIRTEREYCCDDVAVELTHAGVAYARALTALETWRGSQFPVVVSTTGGSLMHRIQRLLGVDHSHSGHGALQALGALALATTIAASAHGFAGASDAAPDPAAAQDGEGARKVRHVHVDDKKIDLFKVQGSSRRASGQDAEKVHEHLQRALKHLRAGETVKAENIAAMVSKILAETTRDESQAREAQTIDLVHENLRRVVEELQHRESHTQPVPTRVQTNPEDAGVVLDAHAVISTDRRYVKLEVSKAAQDHLERAKSVLHEHGVDAELIQAKIHEALGRVGVTEEHLHSAVEQHGAAQDHVKRAMQQLHEHGIDIEQIQAKIHEALGGAGVSEVLLHRAMEQQGAAQDHLNRAMKQLHEHGIDASQIKTMVYDAMKRADVSTETVHRALEPAAEQVLRALKEVQGHEGDAGEVRRRVRVHAEEALQQAQRHLKELHVQDIDVQSILKHVHETIEESGALHEDGGVQRILREVQGHQRPERSDVHERNDVLKAQIEKLRAEESELRDQYKKTLLRWNEVRSRSEGEQNDVKEMKQKSRTEKVDLYRDLAEAAYLRALEFTSKEQLQRKEQPKADFWREVSRTRKAQPEGSDDVMRQVLEALEKAGVDDEVRDKVKAALAGRGKSV